MECKQVMCIPNVGFISFAIFGKKICNMNSELNISLAYLIRNGNVTKTEKKN